MKLKLNKKELFWSIIDPLNVENVLVVLNEASPEADVDFDKLPAWAKSQITAGVKRDKLSTDPVIKSEAAGEKKVTKKVTKKASGRKKVARSAN